MEDLNNRDYTSAIALLEGMHSQSPHDGQTSVLLASAYAGSVGFDIVASYDAFSPLMFKGLKTSTPGATLMDGGGGDTPSSSAASDTSSGSPKAQTSAAVLQELQSTTIRFLQQLTADFQTLARIPFPGPSDRRRLVQALLVLQSIDPSDPSYIEGKTYASVLGALQFLNYTRDAMTGALTKNNPSMINAVCALQVDTFLQNLDTATDYLVQSVDNLNVAYKAHLKPLPSNLGRLRDAAEHVRQIYDGNRISFSDAALAFSSAKSSYCQ